MTVAEQIAVIKRGCVELLIQKELEDKLKKNLEPTLKWVSETDHTI